VTQQTPPSTMSAGAASDKVASNSFAAYAEYNKLLRTWFVTFGVGGAALLLTNDTIATKLATRELLRPVVLSLFVGSAAQVLLALINKTANWFVYEAYVPGGKRGTKRLRCAEWPGSYWIDLALDLLSVATFCYAS
jgi:hypothetical protein